MRRPALDEFDRIVLEVGGRTTLGKTIKKRYYILKLKKKLKTSVYGRKQKIIAYSKEKGWFYLSKNVELPPEFIDKYADNLWWGRICRYQELPEELIEKHIDKISWYNLSAYQDLSESFINNHADKVNWYWIVKYQEVSHELLMNHSSNINWEWVYDNCYQILTLLN